MNTPPVNLPLTTPSFSTLAAAEGYYENQYGAFVHFDTNKYLESFMLRQTEAAAEWAAAVNATVAGTLVPQLFVELRSTPNTTVWTGFFNKLLHSAPDPPLQPRPQGWFPSRGAGEKFVLQARGTKAYKGVRFRVWGADNSVKDARERPTRAGRA